MSKQPKDRPLRILRVAVDNVLRLVSVDITADGRVLEITGKNNQGKSSIVNAIWMALGGEKRFPEVPIHGDAEAGSVIVDLGDDSGIAHRVTRKLKRREDGSIGTTLTVENEEGLKFDKPQMILNTLMGALSVDPLAFMALDSKKQFDMLKALVPDVDFAAVAEANQKDFDERTALNRDINRLVAQAGPPLPDGTPTEHVNEEALIEAMEAAGEHNADIERQRAARVADAKAIETKRAEVKSLMQRADQLRKEATALDGTAAVKEFEAQDLEKQLKGAPALPEPTDTAALRAKIAEAKETNAAVDRLVQHNKLLAEAATLQKVADDLTQSIKDRNESKMKSIAAAKMPIDGITFGEDVVLYKGFPISQASQSEQRRVAIMLSAALNPRLRFVHIRDASLLDSEAWAELEEICEKAGIYVWAETVESGRPAAVVIEDGRVKGAEPKMEAAE